MSARTAFTCFPASKHNPYPATVTSGGVYHFFKTLFCPSVGRVNCALGSFPDNAPISSSRYNSMQVSLNRRFSSNVQAQVAILFPECVDNGGYYQASYNSNTTAVPESVQPVDRQIALNSSISGILCGVNGLWALPFHGNRSVEGWQISGNPERVHRRSF